MCGWCPNMKKKKLHLLSTDDDEFCFTFRILFLKISANGKKQTNKADVKQKWETLTKKNLGQLTVTAAEITERRKNAPQWTKSVQTKGHAEQLSQSVFITRWLNHAVLPFRSEPLDWIFFRCFFFFLSRLLCIDFFLEKLVSFLSGEFLTWGFSHWYKFQSVIGPNYGSCFFFFVLFEFSQSVWFPWSLIFFVEKWNEKKFEAQSLAQKCSISLSIWN